MTRIYPGMAFSNIIKNRESLFAAPRILFYKLRKMCYDNLL